MFNTQRKKGAKFMQVTDVMPNYQARAKARTSVAAEGMRYAQPGERPPSKYAKGEKDNLIARFDAYMRATQKRGVN